MNGDQKAARPRRAPTAVKRDSLAAELERDPQYSTAKRQQRTQLFTNSISHASLERQLLAQQTARVDLETKLREKELQVERLERDRRHLADREKEEREAREQQQVEHDADKKRKDLELKSLRTELSSLKESHTDLQDSHSALSRSTTQTISHQKSLITTLQHRASLLEHELSESRTLADERSQAIQSLQEQVDELQEAKEALTQRGNEADDMAIVRDELQRQATYLRKLEGTNAKLSSEVIVLRDRQTSVEVLREKNRSLEIKLQHMEELRHTVAKLEAELEASRQEREQWASHILPTTTSQPPTPSKTPISQTESLSSLRLAHATLLETHGSTLASLRHLESTSTLLTERLAESESVITSSQAEIKLLKDTLRKGDVKHRLAEREVGFLQALVASFNAEEAQLDQVKIDELKAQRIHELETLLSEYKSTLAALTSATPPAVPIPTSTSPSKETLAQLERLESDLEQSHKLIEEHLARIDQLEQELFELSGEIAGGRHVPPNTRVLQLADNPEQRWFDLKQENLDKLKSENQALLQRLRELEVSVISPSSVDAAPTNTNERVNTTATEGGMVPRASFDLLSSTNNSLQDQLAQKEKRLLRLQQVFQSKSAEFREAIASILGCKLAFYPNGQVRVTSMFDLNASFVFQPAKGGQGGEMKMQLVAQGEGGPQDLPSMMRYWIENEQCIPGFMASVTLECYEKSKEEGELES